MPNTANQQLPYPATGDSPNGPTQFSALATAVEPRLVQKFTSAADCATRRPSPAEGELRWLSDVNEFHVYDGSAWRIWHRSQNLLASTSVLKGTYDANLPIWHWGGYLEATTSVNSTISLNATPPGKTLVSVLSAVGTSSFISGEGGGWQNSVVALDRNATTLTAIVFVFYDIQSWPNGLASATVGFSFDIQFQTSS